MSSSEDDGPEAVAPAVLMAEAKKRRKKRRRPSEEQGGEAGTANGNTQSRVAFEEEGDGDGDGDGDEGAAGEGQGPEGKKRKRRRRGIKKKKGGQGDEGDGGDTTATGAAADDEASDARPTKPGKASAAAGGPPLALADNTVYVEGISYQATEEDLTRFFQDKGCGKVTSLRMPRYQDSGRPRGYAHVEFKKADGVGKALALDGVTMLGRYLAVKRAHEPKAAAAAAAGGQPLQAKPPGCYTVFVKNLPYDATEAAVREAFRFCGKIRTVRLAVWQHTQHQKGFCYVEFEQEAAAEVAVKKQGEVVVGGRRVFVDYETGKPKLSYRAPDGRLWSKKAAATTQPGGPPQGKR